MTRAVIADDERLMRDQLRARLAEVWPALDIVGEARNGDEAVEQVRTLQPDVVFLDIRMPGTTGVEAARRIAADAADGGAPSCEVVFVTAYDEYAIQAFEHGAVDYVLKPPEADRLRLTVRRLQQRLQQRQQPRPDSADAVAAPDAAAQLQQVLAALARAPGLLPAASPPRLQWIQATVGAQIQMIPIDSVVFFISDEKYTRVQTAQTEALIRKPIKELIDEVDPQQFWQIHRSTLVNASCISGVSRDLRGRQFVHLKGLNEKLEVSRSHGHLFKGM